MNAAPGRAISRAFESDVRARPVRKVEHVTLPPDDALDVPQSVANGGNEQRVDVGVEPTVFGEHVEPYEIGLVGIRVVGDHRVVVRKRRDGGDRLDAVQRDQRAGEIPVEPVGQLVAVEMDLVGLEDRLARGDGQVVDEMERLLLRAQPEDEVSDARDRAGLHEQSS